jgi:hypothetical protein
MPQSSASRRANSWAPAALAPAAAFAQSAITGTVKDTAGAVLPGVTVDNNGLAATPTMTFFSAHGGRTNEGRMSMKAACAFCEFRCACSIAIGSRQSSVARESV